MHFTVAIRDDLSWRDPLSQFLHPPPVSICDQGAEREPERFWKAVGLFLEPLQGYLDQRFVVGQVDLQCETLGSTILDNTFLGHGHFQKKMRSTLILSP